MADFSERVRALRKERGLTQFQMSQICGVQPRAYQSYEYKKSNPDVAGMVHLADFFEVSLDYLMGRSDVREIQKTPEQIEKESEP